MSQKKTAPAVVSGESVANGKHRKKAQYRTIGTRSLSATIDDHWKREGPAGYSMHAARAARNAIEGIAMMVGEKVVNELAIMKKHHKRGTVSVENVIGAIMLLTTGDLAVDVEAMLREHVAVLGLDLKKPATGVLSGAAKARHEAKLAREAQTSS